jgi:hypothetical protein
MLIIVISVMFPKFCMLVNCYKQISNTVKVVMCNDMTLVHLKTKLCEFRCLSPQNIIHILNM